MKKRVDLLLASSFLMVLITGCAVSTPEKEPQFVKEETVNVEDKHNFFEINGAMQDIGDYTEIEESFLEQLGENGLSQYELYDTSELTAEMLENRNGKTIIERCIGIVTNDDTGDGAILNGNPKYYYISYDCILDDVDEGTIVLTYMIYDPKTDFIDDIMERYDFIICREYED